MEVNIYRSPIFHCIYILQINNIQNFYYLLIKIIPMRWQLILMNEGSFTQAVMYSNNQKVHIKIGQKKNITSSQKYTNMRCIWMENSLYTKLIFARSLWKIIYLDKITKHIVRHKPIGVSMIEYKSDIHKNIHEIYYGYCYTLERNFQMKTAIWGRKYTVYYNHKSYATIQEFFSKDINNFF